MKLIDTEETVVLVTGTGDNAEEHDRPLAYWLKADIDRRGAGHAYRRAIVMGDAWYLQNAALHDHPTIAIGGPGANRVANEFAGMLPTVYADEERIFVQADFEGELKRATLWGADAAATRAAVEAFVARGLLDDLLGRIWRFRTEVFV